MGVPSGVPSDVPLRALEQLLALQIESRTELAQLAPVLLGGPLQRGACLLQLGLEPRRVLSVAEGEGGLELGEHLMREAISGHQRQSDEGEGGLELGEHLMREAISGHQRQSDEGEGGLELGTSPLLAWAA